MNDEVMMFTCPTCGSQRMMENAAVLRALGGTLRGHVKRGLFGALMDSSEAMTDVKLRRKIWGGDYPPNWERTLNSASKGINQVISPHGWEITRFTTATKDGGSRYWMSYTGE